MGRPSRDEDADAIHHVTPTRSAAARRIVEDDRDRHAYIDRFLRRWRRARVAHHAPRVSSIRITTRSWRPRSRASGLACVGFSRSRAVAESPVGTTVSACSVSTSWSRRMPRRRLARSALLATSCSMPSPPGSCAALARAAVRLVRRDANGDPVSAHPVSVVLADVRGDASRSTQSVHRGRRRGLVLSRRPPMTGASGMRCRLFGRQVHDVASRCPTEAGHRVLCRHGPRCPT